MNLVAQNPNVFFSVPYDMKKLRYLRPMWWESISDRMPPPLVSGNKFALVQKKVALLWSTPLSPFALLCFALLIMSSVSLFFSTADVFCSSSQTANIIRRSNIVASQILYYRNKIATKQTNGDFSRSNCSLVWPHKKLTSSATKKLLTSPEFLKSHMCICL